MENSVAMLDNSPIEMIARWGKNGRKYVWINPTQKQLDDLIEKYGCEQIASGQIKQSNGDYKKCLCVWLES